MEILLVLFLSLLFPLIIYCVTRWLTSEERNFFELPQNRDLLILSQRIAIGFQIVATALHTIPMLKCIEEINHPSSFNDGAQAAVIFIIFPFTLAIFFSGIAYTHCFKYLFYMKSERKAFFILIIPFVTASLIAIVFGGKVIMDIGHTSGSFARNIVIIVASVSMLAITVIFNTQRKRFKHYLSKKKNI